MNEIDEKKERICTVRRDVLTLVPELMAGPLVTATTTIRGEIEGSA